MRAETLHRLLFVSLLAGLLVSLYAAFEVLYTPLQGTCDVSAFFQCGAVDRSAYTTLAGIPDWSIGVGGFGVLLALDIPLIRTFEARWLYAIIGLLVVGLAVAIGLALVELLLIHALCPVCLGAYAADAIALGFALGLWRMRRRALESPVDDEPEHPSAA